MNVLLQSIHGFEEQRKQWGYTNTSSCGAIERGAQAGINELTKIIVKCFAEQKAEYEAKLDELRAENKQIKAQFDAILAVLAHKKPAQEEIAELQARIMNLYAEQTKN